MIETHWLVEWRVLPTPQRNATLDNLGEDFMDLLRFFLVSYHCLVGVSKNIPCKSFLLLVALKRNHNNRILIVGYDLRCYFQLILAMPAFYWALEEGPFLRNISLLQLPLVKCYGQIMVGIIIIFLSDLTSQRGVPQWNNVVIIRTGRMVGIKYYYYYVLLMKKYILYCSDRIIQTL